ncbi:thiamine pyrophosphate-binding protein [Verrucomicrobia bacterium S94]|nr:thiamine pyrophosphate-binding protein [Verrucomicrobia bacterium S94]
MTWKCTVCGYIHEGDEAPDTCPVCNAAASAFEQEAPTGTSTVKIWKCTVCGYEHEGPEPPETCPVCGVPASEFSEVSADTPKTEKMPAEDSTVSDVMVETMINWGVTTVFGMVGHSNLGLADAIRKQCEAGRLTYIGIRHEGAAAFAASAYGKLTGKPAACLSIAGPGATNLLTGLWDARMDRVPILALTGQIDTQVLGPGAFQEVDLAEAFSSVACWSQTVLKNSHHAELMNLALKNAQLQRNVGHLIFPNEVQTRSAPEQRAGTPEGRLPDLEISPPASALSLALEHLNQARHPVIIVGHGARFEMPAVKKLAEKLNCPVITTFKGKGLIRDDDELGCGVLGRSGTPVSAHFMNSADLLLVFGASFAAHTGITPDIPTIQVDRDPLTLGKFHSVKVPVVGEIGITAGLLLQGLDHPAAQDRRSEIAGKKAEWKKEKEIRAAKDQGNGLNAATVFAALSGLIPEEAVIAVDVGNNTYSFGRYFESKGQPVLMSGYLGSIGFGYPAAMGAWTAEPERPIIALTGDGGFGQYMGELCTAVKYGMNITHILINNNELGKISSEQRMAEMNVWETGLHNPDFSAYAEICGAKGFRVEKVDAITEAVQAALDHDGPALVEIMCDPELI